MNEFDKKLQQAIFHGFYEHVSRFY